MAKLDIINYVPVHLEKIQLKSCHHGERPTAVAGQALTIMSGDEPLAIFGWHFICPGTVQLWALVSEKTSEHKKSFHKVCRAFLANGIGPVGARRIQFSVRCG